VSRTQAAPPQRSYFFVIKLTIALIGRLPDLQAKKLRSANYATANALIWSIQS
jgi:hypothetical protein